MAPQPLEKAQSAPENAMAVDGLEEVVKPPHADAAQVMSAFGPPPIDGPEMTPQAPQKAAPIEDGCAPGAALAARPRMAPQPLEKAQSAPEKCSGPSASDEALASLAAPARDARAPDRLLIASP
jgi:hypothetical protein